VLSQSAALPPPSPSFSEHDYVVDILETLGHNLPEPYGFFFVMASKVWGVLDANCDGLVATGFIRATRADIAKEIQRLAPADAFKSFTCRGTDSNWGCGANSNYYVLLRYSNLPYASISSTTPTQGGGGCFAAETPILMADGTLKRISEIKPGDMIASIDAATDEPTARKVKELLKYNVPGVLTLHLSNGETMTVSKNHLILNRAGNVVRADQMKGISIASNQPTGIVSVDGIKETNDKTTVYNLTFEDSPRTGSTIFVNKSRTPMPTVKN
jgi:hypothetical protein